MKICSRDRELNCYKDLFYHHKCLTLSAHTVTTSDNETSFFSYKNGAAAKNN